MLGQNIFTQVRARSINGKMNAGVASSVQATTAGFHTAVDIEMTPGIVVGDGLLGLAAVQGAVDRGREACLTSKTSTTTWRKDGSGAEVD